MKPTPAIALSSVAPVAMPHRVSSERAVGASSAPRVFHTFLGRWAFVACWWLIMGSHAFLGGFALSAAALHWYLQEEYVAMVVSSLNVPKKTLEMTAAVFFLVGFTHFVVVVRVLYRSFQAKRLVLHAPKVVKNDRSGRGLGRRLLQLYDAGSNVWAKLFSPTGFFGFSNPHFETLFLVREGWEILLQTYQAYKLSESVPRKWINQLAVAVIVLNCAGSPLVHLVFRKQEGRRRVLNLLQDALLDYSCSIVIPISILLPYVRAYVPGKGVPSELIMDDVWFVNAVAETRQVLVTSFPDFISTIMPQISLLGYLMTFKNILRRRSSGVHGLQTHATHQQIPTEKQLSPRQPDVPPAGGPSLTPKHTVSTSTLRPPNVPRKPMGLQKLVGVITHMLFVMWGCGVLGLHLEAYRNTDRHIPGCQLHISAWHSSRYPCSVMQLNCHVAQIQGSGYEITSIFDQLERTSLRVLVFTHCPQLTVPPVITEFSLLAGLEFFNCTLVDWPEQVAIHEATQPFVGYMYFVLTNWTSFPAGLLHDQLPKLFTHLFIVASNLTELPETIGLWRSQEWISIVFERVPFLTKLPDSFCSLQPYALWVAGSGLTSLPSECTTHDRLIELGVSGSALRALPAAVGPNFQALNAENIQVTDLPGWFDAWYHDAPSKMVAFHGSALCDSPAVHQGMSLWDETCRNPQPFASTAYPLDMMLGFRPFGGVHVYSS